ncbi:sensor domain-containing diguanylate cyclase [Terrihabitans soli]|nr:sensor domain-containing diguanylate cyclase [Terrihabitans soli]
MTSLVGLAVALAIGAGAVITSRAHSINLVRADLTAVAGVMADRVGRGVEQRLREMTFLSELEPIRGNWERSPATIRRVLDLLQDGTHIYAWIGFADRSGKVLAATDAVLEGMPMRSTAWFERGLAGSYVGDVYEARSLVGNNQVAVPQVFDVAVPVLDAEGELLGVLGAQVNWSWFAGLRDAALATDLHASTSIYITRRDGTALLGALLDTQIISREAAEQAYSKGRGTTEEGDLLKAFSVMRGREGASLGWIIVTTQPRAIALAQVNQMTFVIVLIGCVMAIVALLAAGALANRLARPLRALTAEADRIGTDRGATLGLHKGSEEIARLSFALRALLARLGHEEKLRMETAEELNRTTTQFASQLRSLKDLADTDALTGLRNRRFFEEAAHYQKGAAILALDIDHFKSVNDRFGHLVGDEVLKQVAAIVALGTRATDLAARFGGEEFVVLLRGVGPQRARMLANRMRVDIERAVKLPDGRSVTVSLGVAAWQENEPLDIALGRADIELYRAKETGRNRVCVAGTERAA